MFSPLHNPTYRKLFGAQVVALVGTGLASVALALMAFDMAGDQAGTVLGTALALKMIAYVGVSPLVGGWVHRVQRKNLLIGLDVGRALLVLCLPFVSAIWQIYVLIFLLNACSAGFTPTFQSTIPAVLPDEEQYTKALSLSRLAYDLENLISPALAAAALFFLTYHDLFLLNALGFVCSALMVWTAQFSNKVDDGINGFKRIQQGVKIYLGTPRLRALLALSGAVAMAGSMVIVNTVVYVQGDLLGNTQLTAVVLAAFGAGSMLAAMIVPRMLVRLSDRTLMLGGGVLLSVALLLGISGPGYALLIPIWFFMGLGSSCIQTPAGRILTRSAAEIDRPMLFSAQFALSHACWLVAYPLAGWLGGTFDFAVVCGVLGAFALVFVAVAWQLWQVPDDVVLSHKHKSMLHSHMHVHDAHHAHTHEHDPGNEPHEHMHEHQPIRHSHPFVLDEHHSVWPR